MNSCNMCSVSIRFDIAVFVIMIVLCVYIKRCYFCLCFVIVQQVEGLSGGEEGGTYFVDQSGQYYYQANSDEAPVMTQVQIQEVEESDVQTEGELAQINASQDDQYQEIEELETAEADDDVSRVCYGTCASFKCSSAFLTCKYKF